VQRVAHFGHIALPLKLVAQHVPVAACTRVSRHVGRVDWAQARDSCGSSRLCISARDSQCRLHDAGSGYERLIVVAVEVGFSTHTRTRAHTNTHTHPPAPLGLSISSRQPRRRHGEHPGVEGEAAADMAKEALQIVTFAQ